MTVDRRHELLRAAAEEIALAGVEDIFGFLTPARLAESRDWSEGTVRYQFRRDGLAFDRPALISELNATIVERARVRFGRWSSSLESAFARGEGEPHDVLTAGFIAVAKRISIAAGDLRVVAIIEAAVTSDIEPVVASAVRRVIGAYAAAETAATPPGDVLDELAHAIAARITAGDVRPDALAALTRRALIGDRAAAGEGVPMREDDEHPEDEVLRLERRLDSGDHTSVEALRIVERLATIGPMGDWVFGRVRARLEQMLAMPGLRDTPRGQRIWVAAAEVVAMAAGDRELADEAVAVALASRPLEPETASLRAALRTGWLLVRLDRLEEAVTQFARVRRLADGANLAEPRALADAFTTLATSLTGPLEACYGDIEVRSPGGPRSRALELSRALAAAASGRALLLSGQNDDAARVLFDPAYDTPASLGTSMVQLYRAWVLLARGEDGAAHATLTLLRERLSRLGVRNPAGWPWLEPTVAVLVRLDHVDRASALIASTRAAAERWSTPLVLAEVERARALVAETDAARRASLRRARALLAGGPAVERERAELTVQLLDGSPATVLDATGVSATSILVQIHAHRGGPLEAMSPRVREVALLAAAGVSNDDIAARLAIAPSTVARHVSAALRVTGTRNRTELAAMLAPYATRRSEL